MIATLPTTPGIRRCTWGVNALTRVFAINDNTAIQTAVTTAWRWAARYELPPMRRAEAATWAAFLVALHGKARAFWGYDPGHRTASGTLDGTPTIHGGSNTGETLMVVGWTPGASPVLVAGDYIAWNTDYGGREMHKVTTSATAYGTNLYNAGLYNANGYGYGETLLAISPPIRESPAHGQALLVSDVSCVMQLTDDEGAAWDLDEAAIYGIAFDAIERIADNRAFYTIPLAGTSATTAACDEEEL